MIIGGNKTQISRRDFHIMHSVHCELNYIVSTNICTVLDTVYVIFALTFFGVIAIFRELTPL
jgi:hypothetical protein